MLGNCFNNAKNYTEAVKMSKSLIVFDTETTGLKSPDTHIIQFSAVKYDITEKGLVEKEVVNQFINPEMELPEKIIEITGITDEILENKPVETEVMPQIFEWLQTADLWVGHNIPFDIAMLDYSAARLGVDCYHKPSLDTLVMARDLMDKSEAGSHKLQDITPYLFPEAEIQFHLAIEDVRATAMCLTYFITKYQQILNKGEKAVPQHLEWATFSVNPRKRSEKRIKLCLDKEKKTYGCIYYDCINHVWGAKKDKFSQDLFNSSDIHDLERQLINRYGSKYNNSTDMYSLAREMELSKKES